MRNQIRILMLGTVLLFLNMALFTAHVSAQGGIGISKVTFDKASYALGSSGTVSVSVDSIAMPSHVSYCVVNFYSFRTDGDYNSWATGSGGSTYDVPAGTTVLSYTFTIPTDAEIISGPIYYTVSVDATQNGRELAFTTILHQAHDSENNDCFLNNPLHLPYLRVVSDYNSLYSNYNTLSSQHSTLQSSYDSLKNERDSLATQVNSVRNQVNSLQTQVYGLAVFTIILLVTTIYFAIRPRMKL